MTNRKQDAYWDKAQKKDTAGAEARLMYYFRDFGKIPGFHVINCNEKIIGFDYNGYEMEIKVSPKDSGDSYYVKRKGGHKVACRWYKNGRLLSDDMVLANACAEAIKVKPFPELQNENQPYFVSFEHVTALSISTSYHSLHNSIEMEM